MSDVNFDLTTQDSYRLLAALRRYLTEHPTGESAETVQAVVRFLEAELK